MFTVQMRKILLVVTILLMTILLCSCGSLTMQELPLETRLTEDVEEYLEELAGNEVVLNELTIDSRDYSEKNLTLVYELTIRFAWDEFSEENTNSMQVYYVMTDGSWEIVSMDNDIDMDALNARIIMQGLYTDAVDLPDAVNAVFIADDIVLSDSKDDYTVTLQDVTYQFPCSLIDFTQRGWEIAEDEELSAVDTLTAQTYIQIKLTQGDETISLFMANQTNEPIYIGECECVGLILNSSEATASYAGGITQASTADEVIAAYGTPTGDETTDEGRTLTYETDDYSRMTFLFGLDDTQITMSALKSNEEETVQAALFDTYSFEFELDGTAYALPAQLQSFLDQGWAAESEDALDEILQWYESMTLTLTKDGQSVMVTLTNPSLGDLSVSSASVTGITMEQSAASFALPDAQTLSFAQAESLTVTQEQVIAALGEPSETADGEDGRVLTYLLDDSRYLRITLGSVAVVQLQAAEGVTAETLLSDVASSVNIDGDSFDIPSDASQFQDATWIPVCGWEQVIDAGSFVEMTVENRRIETMTLFFANVESGTVTLDNCMVCGLYADSEDIAVTLSRSLTQGVSADEVIAVFGLPDHDITDGTARYLIYGDSIQQFMCLQCIDDQLDAMWIIVF